MPQGDIRLELDELHADFARQAPKVLVTCRVKRIQIGETLQRVVGQDAQGADIMAPYTEETTIETVAVQIEYPTKAAFWNAGTAMRDALVAEFRKNQKVAQKPIG